MPELDRSLLQGFSFACRPDCGLCCYASPVVTATEKARLIQLEPSLDWTEPRRAIPSRAGGGGCQYLRSNRCRVHEARPFPCAEFPIAVHLGPRAQATLVLSCPGLSAMPPSSGGTKREGRAPVGLEAELRAVEQELGRLPVAEWRRAEGTWRRAARTVDASDPLLRTSRAAARRSNPGISAEAARDPTIPTEADGLDRLPMFFDERFGRVAIAASGEQVDLLVLRENGGIDRRLATFPRAVQPPSLTADAARRLAAYRDHLLERDAFVGAALRASEGEGTEAFTDQLASDLDTALGATVARGRLRSLLSGRTGGPLSERELVEGIAATDADYLDRPTVGRWL